MEINNRTTQAMAAIAIITLLLKGVNLLKEMVIAARFGVSGDLDVYLFAFIFPTYAVAIIVSSFNTALIPTFVSVREKQGHAAANALLGSIVTITIAAMFAVTAIAAAILPPLLPLLAAGFSTQKIAMTKQMIFLLWPLFMLNGFSNLISAVLNAQRNFRATAGASTFRPLAVMACIVLLATRHGVYAVAAGMIAGSICEVFFLLMRLRQCGYSLQPRLARLTPEVREILRQYGPMMAGGFIMSGTGLVDQSMAATLQSGSVASLGYGTKIVDVVLAVGIAAVGTALLPDFAEIASRGDWRLLDRTGKAALRLALVPSIVLCLTIALSSPVIVQMVFGRGLFTADQVRHVAAIQTMAALQIPPFLLCVVAVRLLSAIRASRTIMMSGVLNFCTNIALDYAFMHWIGVRGIALATAFVYLINFAFLYGAFKLALTRSRSIEMPLPLVPPFVER